MALLDLSLVTRALVKLVDETIKVSPAAPGSHIVTSLPPDKLTEENSVGIYLYHITEEAALKNQGWRGRPDTPIKYSPIGLNLHYVVTAFSVATNSQDPFGPYREQLLVGLAIKALHDFPVIDDDTTVSTLMGPVKVLDAAMQGDENKLRLTLRHVPAAEAVSYWTAGSQPLRLSVYYEVSVVLMEPEAPTVGSGRVLTWGVEALVGGLPRVTASRSKVSFTIPGEPSPRSLEVQPAQVAIGDELTLVGTGLGGGPIEVLVRRPGASAAVAVDPTWGTSAAGDTVFTTVQDLLDGTPPLPGAYAASVRITRTSTLADGSTKVTPILSNETPFQVVPAVDEPIPAPVAGVFTITGGRFADALTPVVARAQIGGVELVAGTAGSLAPGQYAITSPTSVELRLPPGATSGQKLPVRMIVNGSESPPRWVEVP